MNRDYRYSCGSAIRTFLWDLATGELDASLAVVGSQPYHLWSSTVTINPISLAMQDNLPNVPEGEVRILFYPYSGPSRGTLWGIKRARILFNITGPSNKTYPVADWMLDVLNRYDDTAKMINSYVATNTGRPDIIFKSVRADQTNIKEDNLGDYAFGDSFGADTDFSTLSVTVTCDYVVESDYLKSPAVTFPNNAFFKDEESRTPAENEAVQAWKDGNNKSVL
jgi:hypothetical protein